VKVGNKVFVRAGEVIDREAAAAIDSSKIDVVKIRSPITCKTLYGVCAKCYGYDLANNQPIKIGEAVGIVAAQSIGEPGTQLTMRTFHIGGIAGADITSGLPRVEELFEARSPKGKASLVEEDGVVTEIEERGLLKVIRIIGSSSSATRGKKPKSVEYTVSRSAWVYVKVGDEVKRGDQLSEGPLDLRELFRLKGSHAVEQYILREVQKIYLSEGATINNKHIEVIIRQMLSRVKITEIGDSDFVRGDIVEASVFTEANRRLRASGGRLAKAQRLLMGITKVALSTESVLSAASFQETTRVLINAAVEGKVDRLRGLKENVIIGRLIPAGTGFGYKPASEEEAPPDALSDDTGVAEAIS
jgi:DNA-directed RNA polymerase subunit beta'